MNMMYELPPTNLFKTFKINFFNKYRENIKILEKPYVITKILKQIAIEQCSEREVLNAQDLKQI